jgi:hypothetical protein
MRCLRYECNVAGHRQEVQCPCATDRTGTASEFDGQSGSILRGQSAPTGEGYLY